MCGGVLNIAQRLTMSLAETAWTLALPGSLTSLIASFVMIVKVVVSRKTVKNVKDNCALFAPTPYFRA